MLLGKENGVKKEKEGWRLVQRRIKEKSREGRRDGEEETKKMVKKEG